MYLIIANVLIIVIIVTAISITRRVKLYIIITKIYKTLRLGTEEDREEGKMQIE